MGKNNRGRRADITVVDELVNDENVTAAPIEDVKLMEVCNCTALNVREAPDKNAAIRCTIPVGTRVNATATIGDFTKIVTSGIEGYCMTDYLTLAK